ncbi:hypothetical protein lerEdw1_005059 [Lerista edwardsae]|nr:hypothetical protein lerEdw1_005059 [Lerista edwardsae]
MAKSCSWLALHVSWAFPIVCGLFFILTIIYFLLTSFTDTGILHRGIEEEMANQVLTKKDVNLHWCNQCQLYCLPHTFHCSWCNTCVEVMYGGPLKAGWVDLRGSPFLSTAALLPEQGRKGGREGGRERASRGHTQGEPVSPAMTPVRPLQEFNHHCMWLNNCIGCHNLRSFFLFVAFLSGYDLAVLASCLAYIVLNNLLPGFNAEKICTVLVTIPTAFYLVPLLVLLYTHIGYIFSAVHKCKCQAHCTVRHALHGGGTPCRWRRHSWTWHSALRSPHGHKYRVRSERPATKATILKDRRASKLRRAPPMASFGLPAGGSSARGSPREQQVAKAWRHFLSAVGNLLRRRGPRLGTPAEQAAKSGGKRKTGWQLNTNARSMEIPIPDMLDSLELLDEDQNTHWKCQIHLSRRAPSSPTATLLSVSEI